MSAMQLTQPGFGIQQTKARKPSFARNRVASAALLAMAGLSFVPSAQAATCTWNTTSGNWNALANWLACVTGNGSPAGTPGSVDTAIIGSTGVVTINSAQAALTLQNAGRINLDTSIFTIGTGASVNSGTLNVGSALGATLVLNGGSLNNAGGTIAIANNSTLFHNGSNVSGGSITTAGTGALVAGANVANLLTGVTLSGTLDATSVNARQRLAGGFTLNGNVNVGGSGIVSLDSTGIANQTIGGNGVFNLLAPGSRLAIEGSGVTTLASTVVVRGQGNVGTALFGGGDNTLVNQGRFTADVAGGTLELTPPANGGGSSITNQGLLDARSGGTLQISTNVNNAGGVINAAAGSTVVQNGVSITGGTISSAGTGVYVTSNSANNVINGVTQTGTLDLTGTNARLRIVSGAVLGGAVNIGNSGILSLDSANTPGGAVAITGTGVINLNAAGSRLAIDGSGTTSIASGFTVRGQGNIGQALAAGGNNTLTNSGLISADIAGGTLDITAPANGGSSGVVNNGTLQAINGATLRLSTNITANAGSQISAGAGSTVLQNGVTITGIVNTTGGGSFAANNSGSNILNAVTLNGVLDLTSTNARERIVAGLTLNGTVNVGNTGILSLDSTSVPDQTISGSGTIHLQAPGSRLSVEGSGNTTLASGITVRGQGNIGTALFAGGNNALTNNGLISADVGGGTLDITAPANGGSSSFTNNGTLQAINGATLQLSTHIAANAGSQILASAGSTVLQNGVTVTGIVNTSGGGLFTANNSGNNILRGVTLNGTLDMSGTNARERIVGGLVLNGSVNVGPTGILSLDSTLVANQTISGAGTINLNGPGSRLSVEGSGVTTLASGVVVRGQGNVGTALFAGGNNNLVNNGRITADVAGGSLDITAPANGGASLVTNSGLLDARGGGILQISSHVNNAGGTINAATGSTVVHNGITVTGGTIGSAGTGRYVANSSGNNVINGVTLVGVMDMTGTNARMRVVSGSAINGAVNIGATGIMSLDSANTPGGAVAITGTGSINLNDAAARLSIEGSGTSSIAAGLTVRGQGNIGTPLFAGGNNTFSNNGLISADVSGGTLTISAPANGGSSAFTGTGTLQATNGGILSLAIGRPSTQGTLAVGAAGSLNTGNQNLTLLTDYTNAQAGSGNSFNRRAGIVGTGQILAGGDVGQVISGAGVTGGNTATATLTISNVRVGANTYTYTVGASGTSGPAMRGGLQTSVNGGNITDARLSGSGVTAGNYNGGAPGGTGDARSVTFTAASAGALAALSGQAVNLRSTYDNIADQRLNIVLASGAAAYNAAAGQIVSPVLNFGTVQVGQVVSQNLVIRNSATGPAGFVEDLRAAFGASSGTGASLITGTGGLAGITAGANSSAANGTMTVAVNTASVGTVNGSIAVNYFSQGRVSGVSNGLAEIGVGSEAYGVAGTIETTATVINQASPLINNPSINLGNVRIGSASPTANVSITNVAAVAPQAALNASISGSAPITASGSFTLLNPGATNASALQVGMNTATAGAIAGTATVSLVSDASNVGGCAPACQLNLASQTVNVSGNVYRLASPQLNTPSLTLAARVGGSASGNISVTNASPDAFTEALRTSAGAAPANFSVTGSPVTVAAQSTGSMGVSLNTSTAGSFGGTVILSHLSTGAGTTGAADIGVGSSNVNLTGRVYTAAQATTQSAVNFGIVHVGDAVALRSVSVQNTAAATALNDSLRASIGGTAAPFTNNGGSVSGLAAGGAADTSALRVGLNTATAGVYSGTASVSLASQNADMADLALASQSVALSGTVNNFANAVLGFSSGSGSFTRVGNTFTLDFGNVVQGSGPLSAQLNVANAVAGPADELDGAFSLVDVNDFNYSGFANFLDLAAGAARTGYQVVFGATSVLGSFSDSILLSGFGHNASGYRDASSTDLRLVILGNVVASGGGGGGGGTVPEPSGLFLMAMAAACAAYAGRKTRRQTA